MSETITIPNKSDYMIFDLSDKLLYLSMGALIPTLSVNMYQIVKDSSVNSTMMNSALIGTLGMLGLSCLSMAYCDSKNEKILREQEAAKEMITKVNFEAAYGISPQEIPLITPEQRAMDIERSSLRLNEICQTNDRTDKELTSVINKAVTDYIESVTGQSIESNISTKRMNWYQTFGILGTIRPESGTVLLGPYQKVSAPHTIGHEIVHLKIEGTSELETEALTYLALKNSGDLLLEFSTEFQRLFCNLKALLEKDYRIEQLVDKVISKDIADMYFSEHPPKIIDWIGTARSKFRRHSQKKDDGYINWTDYLIAIGK